MQETFLCYIGAHEILADGNGWGLRSQILDLIRKCRKRKYFIGEWACHSGPGRLLAEYYRAIPETEEAMDLVHQVRYKKRGAVIIRHSL